MGLLSKKEDFESFYPNCFEHIYFSVNQFWFMLYRLSELILRNFEVNSDSNAIVFQ